MKNISSPIAAACAAVFLLTVQSGCQPDAATLQRQQELQLQEAVIPSPGNYRGATRQQVIALCGLFPHYGLDGQMIVVGDGEYLYYFFNEKELLANELLMKAPVWRVNFQPVANDPGAYQYDELVFDAGDRVSEFRRNSFRNPTGEL